MEGLGTTVSYATMGLGTSNQTGEEFIGTVGSGAMPEHMKKVILMKSDLPFSFNREKFMDMISKRVQLILKHY